MVEFDYYRSIFNMLIQAGLLQIGLFSKPTTPDISSDCNRMFNPIFSRLGPQNATNNEL
jgi:hypothetical protein